LYGSYLCFGSCFGEWVIDCFRDRLAHIVIGLLGVPRNHGYSTEIKRVAIDMSIPLLDRVVDESVYSHIDDRYTNNHNM